MVRSLRLAAVVGRIAGVRAAAAAGLAGRSLAAGTAAGGGASALTVYIECGKCLILHRYDIGNIDRLSSINSLVQYL